MPSAWVLVADTWGQSRSAVATVRALAAAGYRVAATTGSCRSLAAASRYCRRRVPVPMVGEPEYTPGAFAAAIKREIEANEYLTVMPTSDAALLALGHPVRGLVDKRSLMRRARGTGFDVPPTEVFASWRAVAEASPGFDFPVVTKPAVSTWAPQRFEHPQDILAHDRRPGPILVQPYFEGPVRAVAGVVWRGELVAAVHQRYLRRWPRECGTSSAAVTIERDLETEWRLLRLLGSYEGVFQAQFAGAYLLDVNPRPYGSLPLAVAAGANLAAISCDLLRGLSVAPVRARTGVFYRWLEADLRHVWQSVRIGRMTTREAVTALRPRTGAAHSTESLIDPGPSFARLRFAFGGRR